MSRIFRTLIVAVALCGLICSCGKESGTSMTIDVSNPQEAVLDDIATSIRVLPVTNVDSSGLGNVFYAKSCSNLMFFFDENDLKIHNIFDDGTRVYTWTSYGRGPEDYLDIGTFTFNNDKASLEIFERETLTIKASKMMDSQFLEEREFDYYINAMEWIKGDTYLFVREESEPYTSDSSALVLYDMGKDKVIDSIHLRADQSDAVMDFSISRMGVDKEVYVAVPGMDNVIYSITEKGFTPVFSFKMKPDCLSEINYWEGDYTEEKEEAFFDERGTNAGRMATMPCMYIESEDTRSFYYYAGGEVYSHNLPDVNLCVLHGTKADVYKTLTLKGIDNPILPLGVFEGKYVALLEADDLEWSGEMGDAAKKIQQAQSDGSEYVIVEYSFK